MTRAERIYNIFKKLHSYQREILIDGYKKIFNTDNVFDVYFYLERLYREIEILENELDIPQKIYKSILNKCKALTKNYSFNTRISAIGLNEKELATFYGFSFYGVDEEIIEIDINEDLEIMLNSISDLENTELKLILADITSSLNKIQTLPKITGINSIQGAFKEIYCKTQINITEINNSPAPYKQALINAYTKIDKALEISKKWIGRVDTITKLIGELQGVITSSKRYMKIYQNYKNK